MENPKPKTDEIKVMAKYIFTQFTETEKEYIVCMKTSLIILIQIDAN